MAISQSSLAVGSGTTAQSPKTKTSSSKHIKKAPLTVEIPSFVLISCKAGRIVSAVVPTAPLIIASAFPTKTSIVAK